MDTIANKVGVVQNMGLIDRMLRFVIGGAMLGVAAGYVQATGGTILGWQAYLGVVSIYPFITAILGWDPLYHLFNAKSCSLDAKDRNQCGTFPYEVEAALGKNPRPNKDFDHSVFGSHH